MRARILAQGWIFFCPVRYVVEAFGCYSAVESMQVGASVPGGEQASFAVKTVSIQWRKHFIQESMTLRVRSSKALEGVSGMIRFPWV